MATKTICKRAVGVLWFVLAFGNHAFGDAITTVDLSVTLLLPPAVENRFGFAVFPGNGDTTINQTGNASAFAEFSVTHFMPLQTEALVTAFASGAVTLPAHADSSARTLQKINLANLTGSGGPTGPPEPIPLAVTALIVGTINLHADTPDERAEGLFSVFLFDQVFTTPGFVQEGAGAIAAVIDTMITAQIVLPANSVTPILLRTVTFGSADSVVPPDPLPPIVDPPPPLPGPSALMVFGFAMTAGVLNVYRRRTRKHWSR